jgi:hypothetical protein
MALRVGLAHGLRHRGHVDLHRVDFQIRQACFLRQPHRQRFHRQRLAGVGAVFGFGARDHHQRMQFDRAAARAAARADALGVVRGQQAVGDQRGQHFAQFQATAAADQRG